MVFLLSGCCPADRWRECDFACELAHEAEDAGAAETESQPERRVFKVLVRSPIPSIAFPAIPDVPSPIPAVAPTRSLSRSLSPDKKFRDIR